VRWVKGKVGLWKIKWKAISVAWASQVWKSSWAGFWRYFRSQHGSSWANGSWLYSKCLTCEWSHSVTGRPVCVVMVLMTSWWGCHASKIHPDTYGAHTSS
jgi:hypothetical protein